MTEHVFFDGQCALCHGFVRFVVARDRDGTAFRFAPLQGETFRAAAAGRGPFPDSVVLRTADGRFLIRSEAVVHVLGRLGPFWRATGTALRLVPRPVRDWGYDLVAALRRRLLAPPPDLCPVPPGSVRRRFDP